MRMTVSELATKLRSHRLIRQVFSKLLELKADVDAANKWGKTPLMFGCEKGRTEVCLPHQSLHFALRIHLVRCH